jgi:hypothetical protein
MTQAAQIALRAAMLRRTVGEYAARKYAERNGVLGLYRLALQLKGVTK